MTKRARAAWQLKRAMLASALLQRESVFLPRVRHLLSTAIRTCSAGAAVLPLLKLNHQQEVSPFLLLWILSDSQGRPPVRHLRRTL